MEKYVCSCQMQHLSYFFVLAYVFIGWLNRSLKYLIFKQIDRKRYLNEKVYKFTVKAKLITVQFAMS